MSLLWRNFDRDNDRADLRSLPPAGPSQPVAMLTVTEGAEGGARATSHYLTSDAARHLRDALHTLLLDAPAEVAVRGGLPVPVLVGAARLRDCARDLVDGLVATDAGNAEDVAALVRLATIVADLANLLAGAE